MDLIFDLLILAFFGRGELLVCHSVLCRLVSGSYSKIHDSSPIMFERFSSFSMRSRPGRTLLRFSFSSLVRFFGTSFAQIFHMPIPSVKMSWTVGQFKFQLTNDHSVKCRSNLMTAPTLVTFSSVFDLEGLPERGSSSILSRPPKNALCHLKTRALDNACSP